MHTFSILWSKLAPSLLIAIGLISPCWADTHNAQPPTSSSRAVVPALPAQEATDLKFRDFFKMPIGPRGLQPTEKLLRLNGQRVRILGYMAKQETAPAGLVLLTPLPVTMGDEDEGLADDLPPTTVFVHLQSSDHSVPYVPGLLRLNGILSVGGQAEPDGRISTVRLLLDATASEQLLRGPQVASK